MASPPSSRSPLLAAAAIVLAGALAGCAPQEPTRTGSVGVDGYRTRHPIVVEEGEETFDIPVGTRAPRLPPALVSAIEAHARVARRDGAREIILRVPTGSANAEAAGRAVPEITAALVRGGFSAASIQRRTYPAAGPEEVAPIRLASPRLVAHVPHACGEWPSGALSDFGNDDYWNFGCATQANLAAMAANPTDLVAPAPIGQADATRRAAVLQAYRKGEKTKSTFGLPTPTVSNVSGGSE